MLHASHLDDAVLELYCMERLEGTALEECEEHLLLCEGCQDRCTETDTYMRGMRAALANPVPEKWSLGEKVSDFFRMPVPVWATAAVALAGVGGVIATHNLSSRNVPLAVALSATRGGTTPSVSAAKPLDLDLDARDLPEPGSYQIQVVDANGTQLWSSPATVRNGHAHVTMEKRLSPGQYYVRISDPTATRREFALRLGN